MSAVVADAGPLLYLVLIEVIDILPRLFGRVLIPDIVGAELSRPSTPLPVRQWLATAPGNGWNGVQVRQRPESYRLSAPQTFGPHRALAGRGNPKMLTGSPR